jgi:ribulose-phosphate 3-epimerase
MVENPLEWVPKLKGFDRVVFHIESKDDPVEVIKVIKDAGMEAGIAANPETDIEKLKNLEGLDLILIMGVKPGFQGKPFEENTYDRIKQTSQFFANISVDGAVKDVNAPKLIESGAKVLVSGSFILKGDVDENLEKLWDAINK